MAAVSPDGKYLAVVSAAMDAVYIGSLSGRRRLIPGQAPAERNGHHRDQLGRQRRSVGGRQRLRVMMLPPGSGQVPVEFTGSVSDLSVAPDGVRIAFIAQLSGQAPALYLAAIGGWQQNAGELGAPAAHLAIKQAAVIGPNLTGPVSLAWYDVDNLVVLNAAPDGNGYGRCRSTGSPPRSCRSPRPVSPRSPLTAPQTSWWPGCPGTAWPSRPAWKARGTGSATRARIPPTLGERSACRRAGAGHPAYRG